MLWNPENILAEETEAEIRVEPTNNMKILFSKSAPHIPNISFLFELKRMKAMFITKLVTIGSSVKKGTGTTTLFLTRKSCG
jgi:hypothetical protein